MIDSIPITKPYTPSLEIYTSYLEGIWQRGSLTNNGPLCQQLANDVADFLGISNLELVSSGTIALQLAIKRRLVSSLLLCRPSFLLAHGFLPHAA